MNITARDQHLAEMEVPVDAGHQRPIPRLRTLLQRGNEQLAL